MKNDASKIIVSFIAGAAAGIAVGILLAPDRGSDTRRKIRERVLDLEKDLESSVESKFNEIKQYVSTLVGKASDSADKAAHNVEKMAKQAQSDFN
jgi:gas vesicle protein